MRRTCKHENVFLIQNWILSEFSCNLYLSPILPIWMLPGFTKWSQISGHIAQGEREDLQASYYNIYIIIGCVLVVLIYHEIIFIMSSECFSPTQEGRCANYFCHSLAHGSLLRGYSQTCHATLLLSERWLRSVAWRIWERLRRILGSRVLLMKKDLNLFLPWKQFSITIIFI